MLTAETDYRFQFTDLPHSLAGVLVAGLKQLSANVETTLRSCSSRSACFIQEEDPLRFSVCFFTLIDYGFLPIPVSPSMTNFQKNRLLAENGSALWWFNGQLENTESASSESLCFKNAYACLTSGTTGQPKFCYLSIEGALLNATAHISSLQLKTNSKIAQCLPIYHSFGLIAYLWTSLISKSAIDFNLMAPTLATIAERYDEKFVLYLSPAQLRFYARELARMRSRPTNSENLQGSFQNKISVLPKTGIVSVGGGSLSSSEVATFIDLFPSSRCFVTYGLTEAGPRVTTGEVGLSTSTKGNLAKAGDYIGRPLPGVETFVLTEQNILLQEGEGYLCIKTPSLKLNRVEAELINENLLRTRDHVRIEDNKIFFLGREDDIIKCGGISIYPADIEKAARELIEISDCIVLKHADSIYEEVPIFVGEGTLDPKVLEDKLSEILSPHQMPKRVFVVPKFPRQSLHKIDRQALLRTLEGL